MYQNSQSGFSDQVSLINLKNKNQSCFCVLSGIFLMESTHGWNFQMQQLTWKKHRFWILRWTVCLKKDWRLCNTLNIFTWMTQMSGEGLGPVFVMVAAIDLLRPQQRRQSPALHGWQVDTIGWVGAFVPRVHFGGGPALLVAVHLEDSKENMRSNSHPAPGRLQVIGSYNVRVVRLHVDVPDGAAGKSPHLGFVFKGSSDL